MKDIVTINKRFADGTTVNESSLLFALEQANTSSSWLRSCAYLVRAVLIDHVFDEGNKRTAAGIIVGFFQEQQFAFHPERVAETITVILKGNITSITTIERLIKHAIV